MATLTPTGVTSIRDTAHDTTRSSTLSIGSYSLSYRRRTRDQFIIVHLNLRGTIVLTSIPILVYRPCVLDQW